MASTNPEHDAEPVGNRKLLLVVTERDIVFNCPFCRGELVVDLAGAGMEVPCSHCGKTLKVPDYQPQPAARAGVTLVSNEREAPPAAPARHFDFSDHTAEQLQRRLGELSNQLKENRSQDTEMRGHINRATMELHRLQIKLKTLHERHANIEAELAALRGRMEAPAP